MAYSKVEYTVDEGYVTTPTFDISFSNESGDYLGKPYLLASHVKVYIDGTEVSAANLTFDETVTPATVTIDTPTLVEGEVVEIRRQTPKTVAGRLSDFADGTIIRANDLDRAFVQNLFLSQELLDLDNTEAIASGRVSMVAGRTVSSGDNLNAAAGATNYVTDITFDTLPADNTYLVMVTPVIAAGTGVPPAITVGVNSKTTSGFTIRHSDIDTSDFSALDILVLSV